MPSQDGPPCRGRIHDSVAQLVGRTPLVRARKLAAAHGAVADLLVKLEHLNPCGSIKDRIGVAMVEDAEARGLIGPGSVLVEATSGNTGIGLAMMAASRGYRVILVMPETVSRERKRMLALLGAEVVLTPRETYVDGAISEARRLAGAIPGGWFVDQDHNPGNLAAHEAGTAQEIWRDTGGKVDALVAGVGTSGTLTGAGQALRLHNPAIRLVAVQPAESPVLTGGQGRAHRITGIGAFRPDWFNPALVDEVISVTEADAIATARQAAGLEGMAVGISSGAALRAALTLAARPEMAGKVVVAIAPSGAERYLSTDLFPTDP